MIQKVNLVRISFNICVYALYYSKKLRSICKRPPFQFLFCGGVFFYHIFFITKPELEGYQRRKIINNFLIFNVRHASFLIEIEGKLRDGELF